MTSEQQNGDGNWDHRKDTGTLVSAKLGHAFGSLHFRDSEDRKTEKGGLLPNNMQYSFLNT